MPMKVIARMAAGVSGRGTGRGLGAWCGAVGSGQVEGARELVLWAGGRRSVGGDEPSGCGWAGAWRWGAPRGD